MFGRSALAFVAFPLFVGLTACNQEVPRRDQGGTRQGAGGAGAVGASGPGTGGSSTGTSGSTGTGGAPSCSGSGQSGPQLLRLMTRWEYAATVANLLGVPPPNVEPIPGSGSVNGYDNDAAGGVVTDRHLDAYLTLGKDLVDRALTTNRAALVPCTAAGCDRQLVTTFGRKAFRRPLTDDEVARYVALFSNDLTQGTFDEGVRLALRSLLLSPHFLYRSEIGEPAANGAYALTPYEIATALSYTFWGTDPDEPLRLAADQGKLSTPAELESQAKRLLADPKSRPQLAHFFGQWLGTSELLNTNKDKGTFPAFTADVAKAMAAEEAAFVQHVVFEGTGAFGELFTANYVFANLPLAQFYGLSAPAGASVGLIPVTPDSHRGGLLSLGSVLASHAHAMDSSPIKRGVFVRRRLLCQTLSDPPPNIDTTPPPLDRTKTTRDRFSEHTSVAGCKQCHQFIDGIGFGFEAFDGVGQYRTTENGAPIDVTGSVVGLETGSNDATPFQGPGELGVLLARSATAQACAATQYFRYTRGFQESGQDTCSVLQLQQAFKAKGLNFKELLISTALEDSFRLRRATR
jgi:hypothetical protein